MEDGEKFEQTALREILEETGMVGRIVEPVDIIAYTYQHAEFGPVDKEVHYYLVEAESGDLRPFRLKKSRVWIGMLRKKHGLTAAERI